MTATGNLAAVLFSRHATEAQRACVAVQQGDVQYTFAELSERAKQVATVLVNLGVTEGARVALLMRDSCEAVVALLGTIYAGAIAVPLSELLTADDVKRYLTHCGASVAIVEAALEPVIDEVRVELAELRELLCVGDKNGAAAARGERDYAELVRNAAPLATPAATDREAPCVLLYSAGFDELRAVPHSCATVVAADASCGVGLLALTPGERVLAIPRMSTAYGLGAGLLFPLLSGATALLIPAQPRPDVIFRALAELRPTVLIATPSIYSQLVMDVNLAPPKPLAGLRMCVAGAESMPERLVPKIRTVLGTEVTVGYGLTELMQFALAGRTDAPGQLPGTCGRALPGVQARVVDDDGDLAEPNEIGTLQLQAPSLAQSYWPSGERLRAAQNWFTTHDRFMCDTAGNFHHCGRVDDLFKVGGKWISPQEIERALVAHEAVWDCAVIGADDEEGLIKPLAFVVTNVGHTQGPALEAELMDYVKNVLAPYKYPRWIDFVDALPRGPGGKVLRYKLRPQRRRRRAETGHQ